MMTLIRFSFEAILLGAVALLLPGCGGSSDARRAEVRGVVTLDGESISKGTITFFPTAGNQGPATGGTIQDGHYHLSRTDGPFVGKNRIEISAPRKTGQKVPWPRNPNKMVDEIVESVPPQYNEESTLVREVQQGPNVLDFELRSP